MKPKDFVKLYIEWYNIAHGENGLGNSPFEDCELEEFKSWNCCETHKKLRAQHDNLRLIALGFRLTSKENLLTFPWWKDFADRYNLELPNQDPFIDWIAEFLEEKE